MDRHAGEQAILELRHGVRVDFFVLSAPKGADNHANDDKTADLAVFQTHIDRKS